MIPWTRRRAEPGDREFFWQLRREAFRGYAEPLFGWDDAKRRRDADAEFASLPLEILEQDGRSIGYVCVLHCEDHDFLDELALIAACRGQGIGSAVVRATMDAARDRGVPLRLSVLATNPAAKLYERLGFRVFTVDASRIRMEWP